MNCAAANQINLVEFLNLLGYHPQKITNQDYWYSSPLREEKEPSFKINKNLEQRINSIVHIIAIIILPLAQPV